MPCNGIAVQTAQTVIDLQEHFQDALNRERFAEYLREKGINVRSWWYNARQNYWALGIETDWIGLAFVGQTIEVSNERQVDFDRHKQAVDTAYFHTQLYAGLLAQQQVMEAMTALGFDPAEINYANGELSFTVGG